jgi:excisionase family DNA binding protein
VLASRDSERRWLTPEAAAERYGVSASALRKRVARGTLPHSRMGRRLLIDTRALERELERHRR